MGSAALLEDVTPDFYIMLHTAESYRKRKDGWTSTRGGSLASFSLADPSTNRGIASSTSSLNASATKSSTKAPLLRNPMPDDDLIIGGLNTWERAWIDTCEGQQMLIVERLCEMGLTVEILGKEGAVQTGYKILIVHAPDELVTEYAKNLRAKLWMSHGRVRDFVALEEEKDKEINFTSAERCQVIHHIIRQGAGLSEKKDPYVKMMFAAQDKKMNKRLAREWFCSMFSLRWNTSRSVIESIRESFGEKIAFHFAYAEFYNRGLLWLSIFGLTIFILSYFTSMVTYMRILPFYSIAVSGFWSFGFLKAWKRRNAELQFEWGDTLDGPVIEYPNPTFKESRCSSTINKETGETVLYYPRWKRTIIGGFLFIYLFVNVLIMIVFLRRGRLSTSSSRINSLKGE